MKDSCWSLKDTGTKKNSIRLNKEIELINTVQYTILGWLHVNYKQLILVSVLLITKVPFKPKCKQSYSQHTLSNEKADIKCDGTPAYLCSVKHQLRVNTHEALMDGNMASQVDPSIY